MYIYKKLSSISTASSKHEFWLTLVLVLSLALIPIIYCAPLLGLGLENESMIEHFAEEDLMFLEFHGQYEEGPFFYPGFRHANVYPKVFYNTAGLFLYPYAYFFGDDNKVIFATWRLINMFSASISGIILFAISKKLFQSNTIAFIGTLCFLSIPQFLLWSTQVRPNPLEQTLILATIFMCLQLSSKYSFKSFFIASLLGGLAFSTKYGGWIFIFIIPIVATYAVSKTSGRLDEWNNIMAKTRTNFLKLSPFIVASCLTILLIAAWILISESFDVVQIIIRLSHSAFNSSQLNQAPIYLDAYRNLLQVMALATLSVLIISVLTIVYQWIKLYRTKDLEIGVMEPTKYSYGLICIWFAVLTITIYVVIFFISAPVYLAHPSHLVSQVGFMFFNTALGGSYGSSGADSYFTVIIRLYEQINPGWFALAILIPIAIYQQMNDHPYANNIKAKIFTLWSYAAITILIVILLRAGSVRHALPGLAILSLLVTYPISSVSSFSNARDVFNKTKFLSGLAFSLLTIFIIFNAVDSHDNWKYLKNKNNDTGLQIGSWISDHYPDTTTILTDQWNFYIPPKFQRLTSTTEIEWDASSPEEASIMIKNHINDTSPRLIVVTHPNPYENTVNLLPILSTPRKTNQNHYEIVKTFDYKYPEKQRYQYRKVMIYENTAYD